MMDRPSESVMQEEAQRARTADGALLENLLFHRSREVLEALLTNPRVGEKHLAILLSRRDLSRDIVARIAQNREWMKSYPQAGRGQASPYTSASGLAAVPVSLLV